MGGIGTAVLKHDIQVQVDGTAQQFVADNPRGHFMVFKRNDIAVQCQIPLICRQRNHNLVKTKKQEILRQMRGTKRAFAGTGDSGYLPQFRLSRGDKPLQALLYQSLCFGRFYRFVIGIYKLIKRGHQHFQHQSISDYPIFKPPKVRFPPVHPAAQTFRTLSSALRWRE